MVALPAAKDATLVTCILTQQKGGIENYGEYLFLKKGGKENGGEDICTCTKGDKCAIKHRNRISLRYLIWNINEHH